MCQNKKWDEARVEWLATFGNVRRGPVMNGFGSERDRGISALEKTKLANLNGIYHRKCSNQQCPGRTVQTSERHIKLKMNDRLVIQPYTANQLKLNKLLNVLMAKVCTVRV
jgi:hypothetical protein